MLPTRNLPITFLLLMSASQDFRGRRSSKSTVHRIEQSEREPCCATTQRNTEAKTKPWLRSKTEDHKKKSRETTYGHEAMSSQAILLLKRNTSKAKRPTGRIELHFRRTNTNTLQMGLVLLCLLQGKQGRPLPLDETPLICCKPILSIRTCGAKYSSSRRPKITSARTLAYALTM